MKILILSQEVEASTNNVISWLNYYGSADITRINGENHFYLCKILFAKSTEIEVYKSNGGLVNISTFDSFWFRRGEFNFLSPQFNRLHEESSKIINTEISKIQEFIHHYLKSKKCLGSLTLDKTINKLINLDFAQKVGLRIPDSLITSFKSDIDSWFSSNSIITKAIAETFTLNYSSTNNSIPTKRYPSHELHILTFDKILGV